MRKIILFTNISLDGFISGAHDNIDWVLADRQLHETVIDLLKTADVMLYGRKTYQIMVDSWPTVPLNTSLPDYMIDFANTLNPMKKIVFSKTLQQVAWNTTLMQEFDPEQIKRLKQKPGKNIVLGGANIAQQFMQYDLIDEFQLSVHPVILGEGKPLFKDLKEKMNLSLVNSKLFDSGVITLYYQPVRK